MSRNKGFNKNWRCKGCDEAKHHCRCFRFSEEKCGHRNTLGNCPQCNLATNLGWYLKEDMFREKRKREEEIEKQRLEDEEKIKDLQKKLLEKQRLEDEEEKRVIGIVEQVFADPDNYSLDHLLKSLGDEQLGVLPQNLKDRLEKLISKKTTEKEHKEKLESEEKAREEQEKADKLLKTQCVKCKSNTVSIKLRINDWISEKEELVCDVCYKIRSKEIEDEKLVQEKKHEELLRQQDPSTPLRIHFITCQGLDLKLIEKTCFGCHKNKVCLPTRGKCMSCVIKEFIPRLKVVTREIGNEKAKEFWDETEDDRENLVSEVSLFNQQEAEDLEKLYKAIKEGMASNSPTNNNDNNFPLSSILLGGTFIVGLVILGVILFRRSSKSNKVSE